MSASSALLPRRRDRCLDRVWPVPLFDYQLDILIRASMAGASPEAGVCEDELICVVNRGLQRSDHLGSFLPTKAAELAVAADILGGDNLPASASARAAASETEEGAPPDED